MISNSTKNDTNVFTGDVRSKNDPNRASLEELPFSVPETPDEAVSDLLARGNLTMKWAQDGILRFHSIKFCSSNARQAAQYFELTFGFEPVAFRGLETGSRIIASHVIGNGKVLFEIVNGLQEVPELEEKRRAMSAQLLHMSSAHKMAGDADSAATIAMQLERDVEDAQFAQRFVCSHGDGVWDVLFSVEDAPAMFQRAVAGGATAKRAPTFLRDENGTVCLASVGVPGTDIWHTLVQNIDYRGAYLPHFAAASARAQLLPPVRLVCVDHAVQNYSWNQMDAHAEFYARCFGLRKFWSVDELTVLTGRTALRLVVMTSSNGNVKIPINEPAMGTRRGQIEEFCDFFGGAGVQHIALRTRNIVNAVRLLRQRGVEFNNIGDDYYDNLAERLATDDIELFEDFEDFRGNHILVDYDASSRYETSGRNGEKVGRCNYIAQIFTTPLHDRPTLFIEIIQRRHHNGFGKGTFKGLFESIERQQELRGTLTVVESEDEEEEEEEEKSEAYEAYEACEDCVCGEEDGEECSKKRKEVNW